MDKELKQNLTATDTWVRALFMLLFLFVYGVAKAVFYLIVIFQFFHALITRHANDSLLDFSENLCAYLYEILLYLAFNSHDLPFPFADWPNERGQYEGESASVTEKAAEPEEPASEPEEPASDPVGKTDTSGDEKTEGEDKE